MQYMPYVNHCITLTDPCTCFTSYYVGLYSMEATHDNASHYAPSLWPDLPNPCPHTQIPPCGHTPFHKQCNQLPSTCTPTPQTNHTPATQPIHACAPVLKAVIQVASYLKHNSVCAWLACATVSKQAFCWINSKMSLPLYYLKYLCSVIVQGLWHLLTCPVCSECMEPDMCSNMFCQLQVLCPSGSN